MPRAGVLKCLEAYRVCVAARAQFLEDAENCRALDGGVGGSEPGGGGAAGVFGKAGSRLRVCLRHPLPGALEAHVVDQKLGAAVLARGHADADPPLESDKTPAQIELEHAGRVRPEAVREGLAADSKRVAGVVLVPQQVAPADGDGPRFEVHEWGGVPRRVI